MVPSNSGMSAVIEKSAEAIADALVDSSSKPLAEAPSNGAQKKGKEVVEKIVITPPDMRVVFFKITGIRPYAQQRFSYEAMRAMIETQEAGSTNQKGKKRDPKDFDKLFKSSIHRDKEGKCGIPCMAVVKSIVSACKLVGFYMTVAKISISPIPDSYDAVDGVGLFLLSSEPSRRDMGVTLPNGKMDIAPKPVWAPGWTARVGLEYDAGQFTASDLYNLMLRAGLQCGIGAGRPDSKKSAGIDYGRFSVELLNQV